MKKLATATALTLIILNTGLAHQMQPVQNLGSPKLIHTKNRTAIKNELVHPVVKLPPKPKLIRSNPFRFTAIRFADGDPWAVPDDEDIVLNRHRAVLTKARLLDDSVSPDIARRLSQAREAALAKYRETWV